ncbi:HD domain-containing protein [Halolactibacillus alkaliphilus]|uniref:bis(5'-nucleosyl)-tetraphosphatase (symmetrical) n=1 Tax=Halolactibacillus alkaliphilus TaxID=442899 RepID=A0A511WZE8_9BACI|nr:bis(5'-nucleosyl)-tetraphosphatase (symmetrical) YqeK [Halolactibacillus alkaliphilus]GEN56067.1 HD domain-containing protein [Halolactibacillus alkaliphilus]GGN67866.1 HD domain-containing protein [Halolactibacillus alkaliphilus]SFO70346.1 putative HD superfamily hydrolase of NAD metabolism [Halolactibacillus alkaliphilus]
MNKQQALSLVKPHLTESRYLHTERVTETALELAARFHVVPEKAMLASVFHDYCKYRPLDEMRRIIEMTATLPNDLLDYHHELWHGPVASVLVETELGIKSSDVRAAIFWHTTGHKQMTDLEKVVYLADYIEPGRDIPGIEVVRRKATYDLDAAVFLACKNSISFLVSKSRKVYPDALNLYNDLVDRVK